MAIVPSTFALMGYGGLAKNILGVITYPFRFAVTAVADGFSGWGMYFASIDALNAENEALKSENQALKDQLGDLTLLEHENERLRAYLGMKAQHPTFTMEEGMVISHSAGNYITTFTVNRGTLHGIETYMPVATEEGIVGYVSEVGLNWCMISTIIETATAVGAYIPRSNERGMVSGDYSMRYDGLCKISLDADVDVKEGDEVLSNGNGSVYPADLKIGTVTEIKIDEYSRTLVATVKPSVDLQDLRWVMIITGFENPVEEEPPAEA